MAKTRDIPSELREFNKIFEALSYRHDYYRVFDDFLTICMGFHACETMNEEWQNALKPYDEKEKDLIRHLYRCWIFSMQTIFNDKDVKWYDFWGQFYEVLSSSGKKSAFGQFFTPPALCDVMAMMQEAEGKTDQNVNDCASGSGRLLLSFNAFYPGNKLFAQDVDQVCCKMTALNLMMHGAKGEVVWGNSLATDDWRTGWSINPRLYTYGGLPHLVKIKKEQSFVYTMWDRNLDKEDKPVDKKPTQKDEQDVPRGTNENKRTDSQLTIF